MADLDWNRFFARYEAAACSFARGLCGDEDIARDLFQEAARAVFERAREGPQQFDSAAHARNYLFRALRNLAADARRHRQRGPREGLDEQGIADRAPGPDTQAMLADRDAQVRAAVAVLRPAEQELLRQRYAEGLTYREIAEQSRVAISTLQERATSALRKIRDRVGKWAL